MWRIDGWLNKAAADGDRETRWYEGEERIDKDREMEGREDGKRYRQDGEGEMFEQRYRKMGHRKEGRGRKERVVKDTERCDKRE